MHKKETSKARSGGFLSPRLTDLVWFLDLQTTGTSSTFDVITEVAWTKPRPLAEWLPGRGESLSAQEHEEVRSSFVRPPADFQWTRSRRKRLKDLCGLELEDLDDAPRLEDIGDKLWRDLASAEGLQGESSRVILLAHYARFELSFLAAFPQFRPEELVVCCTHAWARHRLPELPSKSLRSVAGRLGYVTGELKRAGSHVQATVAVLRGLWDLEVEGAAVNGGHPQAKPSSDSRALGERTLVRTSHRVSLPRRPGVYRFIGPNGTTLYVGKAVDLNARVNSYFRGRKSKGGRLHEMLAQAVDVGVLELNCPLHAPLLENELIKKLDPPYNRALRSRTRTVAWLVSVGDALDSLHLESPGEVPVDWFEGQARILCPNAEAAQEALRCVKAIWNLAEWPETMHASEALEEGASGLRQELTECWPGALVQPPSLTHLVTFLRQDRARRRRLRRLARRAEGVDEDFLVEEGDSESESPELPEEDGLSEGERAKLFLLRQMRFLFGLMFRSRRLLGLFDARVVFHGGGEERIIRFSAGQVVGVGELGVQSEDPVFQEWLRERGASSQRRPDLIPASQLLVAVDSASVLLGEMNRHMSKGRRVSVHERTEHPRKEVDARTWTEGGFLGVLRSSRLNAEALAYVQDEVTTNLDQRLI